MRRYTEKGSIVYDRKKKQFRRRDVFRIYNSMGELRWNVTPAVMDEIVSILAGKVEAGVAGVFSGGSFGGAGATREFNDVDLSQVLPRIMLIIEEI
ncbi:hypothetical protein ES705_43179 [subsurface metagenome]